MTTRTRCSNIPTSSQSCHISLLLTLEYRCYWIRSKCHWFLIKICPHSYSSSLLVQESLFLKSISFLLLPLSDNLFFSYDEPWEDPVWLMPVVLTALIFITICGPAFIWAFCMGFDGFLRMASCFYWVMLWLYFPFLFICGASECTDYSNTLGVVQTITAICTPLIYCFLLIESYFCSERKYIRNLGKTDTVGKTIQVWQFLLHWTWIFNGISGVLGALLHPEQICPLFL